MADRLTASAAWLDAEIADVEAKLAANPPMCTLDRQGTATSGLKELEGRYALLRRARRLLETGGDPAILDREVEKADLIAKASRGASPQWIGYARGVAGAYADIRRHVQDSVVDDRGQDAIPSKAMPDDPGRGP